MICSLDIDGTIADVRIRYTKAGYEPGARGKRYSNWLRRVQNPKLLRADKVVRGMKEFSNAMYIHCSLVYLTGRSEIYREVTTEWLMHNGFPPTSLVMRPKSNRQSNGALKERLINQYLERTRVTVFGSRLPRGPILVIDDDYNGDIEAAC